MVAARLRPARDGYGRANDSGAIGGLTGFNVGIAAGIGVSLLTAPSYNQIVGMWEGAGIGAAASLPIFLFYAGDSGPPAKRGLIFSGVAMALGIAAGGIFARADDGPSGAVTEPGAVAGVGSVTGIVPLRDRLFGGCPLACGGGISVSGVLY